MVGLGGERSGGFKAQVDASGLKKEEKSSGPGERGGEDRGGKGLGSAGGAWGDNGIANSGKGGAKLKKK